MLPTTFWLSYLILAFIITPALFRIRFGHWPYAYAKRPDRYQAIDFAYGAATLAFTAWIVVAIPGHSNTLLLSAGLLLGCTAIALQLWAIAALGTSWRIGQDTADPHVDYTTSGPFRFLGHPIYLSLIALATGMILMAGLTLATMLFAAGTIAYSIIQGRCEARHWQRRRSQTQMDSG